MHRKIFCLSCLGLLIQLCPIARATEPAPEQATSMNMYFVPTVQDEKKPEPDRTMIQLLCGIGMGALVGGATAFTWIQIEGEPGPFDEMPHAGALLLGGGCGYMLGSALGVYIGGLSYERRGSLWKSTLGSVLGTVAGGGLLLLAGDQSWPVLVLAPSVGALVAYSASRSHAIAQACVGQPLLKFVQDKSEWQVPAIIPLRSSSSRRWTTGVQLLSVEL